MGVKVYCSINGSTAASRFWLFAETSEGHFGNDVGNPTSGIQVESSSTKSITVVAVPTSQNSYHASFSNLSSHATETEYGILTKTGTYSSTSSNNKVNSTYDYGYTKVQVIDEHGTHTGSIPDGGTLGLQAKQAVGVFHKSTDEGYEFLGWQVTADTDKIGPVYPKFISTFSSSEATTVSGVTTFSKEYSEQYAIVLQLGDTNADYGGAIFTARYREITPPCTVTYYHGYDSGTYGSDTREVGETIALMAAQSRYGFRFIGWLVRDSRGGDSGTQTIPGGGTYTIVSDASATALWEPDGIQTYTVSYNKNSSDVSGDSIPDMYCTSGNQITIPGADLWKKNGYIFSGWATSSSGDAIYFRGDFFSPSANTILYAVWITDQSSGAQYDILEYRTESRYISEPDYWLATGNYRLVVCTDINENLYGNYYVAAQFPELRGFWIHDVSNYAITKRMEYYDTQTKGPIYLNDMNPIHGGDPITYGLPLCGVDEGKYQRFYPSLSPDRAIVNCLFQRRDTGATAAGHGYYIEDSETSTYPYGEQNFTWEAPTIPGFEFYGWYTLDRVYDYRFGEAAPGYDKCTRLMSSSKTITWGELVGKMNYYIRSWDSVPTYAYYREFSNYICLRYVGVVVCVFFASGIGSSNTLYKRLRYKSKYGDLPQPIPPNEYEFIGWYTSETGGSIVHSTDLVSTQTNHTLYARYRRQGGLPITVTFNGLGGTPSSSSRTYTSGSTYSDLPSCTFGYLSFEGWYTSAFGGSKVDTSDIVQDENHTLYARWADTNCTITLNPSGGVVSPNQVIVSAGNRYGNLPVPVYDGKNFTGWYTAQSGGRQINYFDVVTSSITLYSHWADGGGASGRTEVGRGYVIVE